MQSLGFEPVFRRVFVVFQNIFGASKIGGGMFFIALPATFGVN